MLRPSTRPTRRKPAQQLDAKYSRNPRACRCPYPVSITLRRRNSRLRPARYPSSADVAASRSQLQLRRSRCTFLPTAQAPVETIHSNDTEICRISIWHRASWTPLFCLYVLISPHAFASQQAPSISQRVQSMLRQASRNQTMSEPFMSLSREGWNADTRLRLRIFPSRKREPRQV